MNTRHLIVKKFSVLIIGLCTAQLGAQQYWTQTTIGSYDLSTSTNWESGLTLTSGATDLRFFITSGNTDLSLAGAYAIHNDLTGLQLSRLDLDGQSSGGSRSVTLNGNGFTLTDGAVLNLGNQASSGGNAFGYTLNTPLTLGGGLTISGSPGNPGGVTFAAVTLPSLASLFTYNSNNRVNFNNATINANHSFGGSGTGGITFGGTVTLSGNRTLSVTGTTTPVLGGTVTDGGNNYSITKTGSGILSLAAGNHTIGGGVIVQQGILVLTAGGGTFNHASGGVTIQNGSTIRLDWGGTPSGPVVTTSLNYGTGGGALHFGSGSGNPVTLTYSGSISGSGALTIQHRNAKDTILFSGDYSNYSGKVVVESDSPSRFSQRQAVRFNDVSSRFGSALSREIIVERGGRIGFVGSVSAADLTPFNFRQGGGMSLSGTAGVLDAGFTNPFASMGIGAALSLINFDNLVTNRIPDAINLNMNSNLLNIVGRNANNNPGTEVVNGISVQGGSVISLDRPNSSAGVRIQATSLSLTGSGNTLFIESTNLLDTSANANNSIIITGTKPTVSNGMITPSAQFFTGGNGTADFVTFSGDNLVAATYTSTNLNTASTTDLVNTAGVTLAAPTEVYALRTSGNIALGGNILTIGSGGLIMGSNSHSNGTLQFGATHAVIGAYNAASQANISASISASAGLTILGASQTLNITGTNTNLTGGIFINGGRARFSTAGANGNNITVNNFGTLVVGSSSTDTIGGLSGMGVLSAWQANAGSNTGIMVLSPGSGTHTFNGRLSNGNGHILAITKSGAGNQIFGADSVGVHSGATNVTQGLLQIDGDFSGALGAVTVSGGTLGGIGTIGGNTTIQSGGTLAPGASPGLMTYLGSLTLEGSTVMELDGLTRGTLYDAVNVGTTLTYGGTMTAQVGFSIVSDATFDLFNFTSLSGTFSSIGIGGLYSGATLNSVNSYTANDNVGNTWSFNHSTGVLSVTAIPEPGTLVLVGLSALALVAGLRRRR